MKGSWDGTWEPKGRNHWKFSLGDPKSAFWTQTAVLASSSHPNEPLEVFLGPFSKPENVIFAPGDRPYNPTLLHKDSHQKCILREPYSRNPRGHTPIFIDFLLTYSSRKNPTPARSSRLRRSGQGLVWAVMVWVWVWVWEVKVWSTEFGLGR